MRRWVAAALLALTCAGCSLINYDTNQARQQAGVQPVAWNDALAGCAHRHNVLMAMFGYAHGSQQEIFSCVSWPFSTCDENIGRWAPDGQSLETRTSQQRWFDAWMASPGHRANILDPLVNSEGDDIFVAPDGTVFGTMYLCY